MAVWHDPLTGKTVIYLTLETQIRLNNEVFEYVGGVYRSDDTGTTWYDVNGNLRLPSDIAVRTTAGRLEDGLFWHLIKKLIHQQFFSKPENYADLTPANYENHRDKYDKAIQRWRAFETVQRKIYLSKRDEFIKKILSGKTVLQDFSAIKIDSRNPDTVVYVTSANERSLTFAPHGLWKSTDGGRIWINTVRAAQGWNNPQWSSYRPENITFNVNQSYVAENPMNKGGNGYSPFGAWDIRSFDISPSNPDVLYFESHRAVYRSDDGAKTWNDVTTYKVCENSWMGRGNSNIVGIRMSFHPKSKGFILFNQWDEGLWKSIDGGASLIKLEAYGTNSLVPAAAMDPDNTDIIYKYDKYSGGYFLRSINGGRSFKDVARNPDGSENFSKASHPFDGNPYVHSILIDPKSPKENRKIYICGSSLAFPDHGLGSNSGSGVKVSEDNGKTWQARNNGIGENLNVYQLVMDPVNSNCLYALVACSQKEPGGLFVTADGGLQWRKLEKLPLKHVCSLSVDVNNPKILYASGGYKSDVDSNGGIYRSSDGGNSWIQIFHAPCVPYVAVAPWDSNLIYCASTNAMQVTSDRTKSPGIFRSSNGGRTWRRVNKGLATPQEVAAICFNPFVRGEVWCTTRASGFYKATDYKYAESQKK